MKKGARNDSRKPQSQRTRRSKGVINAGTCHLRVSSTASGYRETVEPFISRKSPTGLKCRQLSQHRKNFTLYRTQMSYRKGDNVFGVLCWRLVKGLDADGQSRWQRKFKGGHRRTTQMRLGEYKMPLAPLVCIRGMPCTIFLG